MRERGGQRSALVQRLAGRKGRQTFLPWHSTLDCPKLETHSPSLSTIKPYPFCEGGGAEGEEGGPSPCPGHEAALVAATVARFFFFCFCLLVC